MHIRLHLLTLSLITLFGPYSAAELRCLDIFTPQTSSAPSNEVHLASLFPKEFHLTEDAITYMLNKEEYRGLLISLARIFSAPQKSLARIISIFSMATYSFPLEDALNVAPYELLPAALRDPDLDPRILRMFVLIVSSGARINNIPLMDRLDFNDALILAELSVDFVNNTVPETIVLRKADALQSFADRVNRLEKILASTTWTRSLLRFLESGYLSLPKQPGDLAVYQRVLRRLTAGKRLGRDDVISFSKVFSGLILSRDTAEIAFGVRSEAIFATETHDLIYQRRAYLNKLSNFSWLYETEALKVREMTALIDFFMFATPLPNNENLIFTRLVDGAVKLLRPFFLEFQQWKATQNAPTPSNHTPLTLIASMGKTELAPAAKARIKTRPLVPDHLRETSEPEKESDDTNQDTLPSDDADPFAGIDHLDFEVDYPFHFRSGLRNVEGSVQHIRFSKQVTKDLNDDESFRNDFLKALRVGNAVDHNEAGIKKIARTKNVQGDYYEVKINELWRMILRQSAGGYWYGVKIVHKDRLRSYISTLR